MQLVHYIDDVLTQGKSEKEVQDNLEKLVELMRNKGWEINPHKIQGPTQTIKFLEIHWHCGNWEIPPKA